MSWLNINNAGTHRNEFDGIAFKIRLKPNAKFQTQRLTKTAICYR